MQVVQLDCVPFRRHNSYIVSSVYQLQSNITKPTKLISVCSRRLLGAEKKTNFTINDGLVMVILREAVCLQNNIYRKLRR